MKATILGSDTPLVGRIEINGSKNSTLPVLAACLLTSEEIQLTNIPHINDIDCMVHLLEDLGSRVNFSINANQHGNHSISIQCDSIQSVSLCEKLSSKVRASVLLLGPLLTRFGKVRLGLIGGCDIGKRSLDIHLDALEQMGAKVTVDDAKGCIEAFVDVDSDSSGPSGSGRRLRGASIQLPFPSVGATENILMAATLAEGTTTIKNASIDPDVVCLTKFLIKLGARIQGVGTRKLVVHGVDRLHGTIFYKIIPDHVEAATYATFAIATAGHLELVGVQRKHLGSAIIKKLVAVGGKITFHKHPCAMVVSRKAKSPVRPVTISTNPYPKFPTDLQPQFCALLCLAKANADSESDFDSGGTATSIVQENVFENRFQHVHELQKLGADIEFLPKRKTVAVGVDNCNPKSTGVCSEVSPSSSSSSSSVIIYGSTTRRLRGCTVQAHDLRGAAALVLAGLVASGQTVIEDFQHLLRGYEAIDVKLRACGAKIEVSP